MPAPPSIGRDAIDRTDSSIHDAWKPSCVPGEDVCRGRIAGESESVMITVRRSCLAKVAALLTVAAIALFSMLGCGGGTSSNMSPEPSPPPPPPPQQFMLTRLSTDTFSNPDSQHATEVEPGIAASGSTIVSAFQVGRRFTGGASDIGFATSTNSGTSWTNGVLPGLTVAVGGTYLAASDPVVAFDKAHAVWIVASLLIASGADQVAVSRSADALNWRNPVLVSSTTDADKQWISCDNTSSSPFFGHCYMEWDDPSQPANGLIWMSTSTDGGLTWSAAVNTAGLSTGIGGQPVTLPNGTVVVPIENALGTQMLAFTSTDGGVTWNTPVTISAITDHIVAGNLRTSSLPAAAVDATGRVYVVWQDCRFRTACSSNDIVLSTSSDGSNWTAPVGIPIDAVTGTVDHFIPALAVDPATSAGSAHLALTYYYYPVALCTTATCQLEVGFVTSQDGGNTWTAPTTMTGSMSLSWLPSTTSGVMVGDYTAVAFSNSHAYAVFAVARANSGTTFDEATYANTNALLAALDQSIVRAAIKAEAAVIKHSVHGPRKFYDLDHEHPIQPRKK
jgi:BNR repeat-like domain